MRGRGSARLVYPRFYTLARLAPWLARWLTDLSVPAPLSLAVRKE